VADDWHEPMVPQRCCHPLPALTDNWTHGAVSRHTRQHFSVDAMRGHDIVTKMIKEEQYPVMWKVQETEVDNKKVNIKH